MKKYRFTDLRGYRVPRKIKKKAKRYGYRYMRCRYHRVHECDWWVLDLR